MPHLGLFGVRIALPLAFVVLAPPFQAVAASEVDAFAPRPAVLSRFVGFAGRIDYAGHRADRAKAPEIEGSATLGGGRFSIAERGPNYELNATRDGATVRSGRFDLRASDPLDADVLLNAWTIAVAALSRGELARRGTRAWQTPPGIVIYLDESGTTITGMSGRDAARLAFTFSAWSELGGVLFPTRIVRLRNGVTDAIFQIDRLDIVRAGIDSNPATEPISAQQRSSNVALAAAPLVDQPARQTPFPWLSVLTSFGSLLMAIAIVAWLRRDTFTMSICARLAADARGWRYASTAAFVDADGSLHFEGNTYRVGPEFFARSVEVQFSPLFIRVSAPGITKAVVVPRLLPRPARRKPTRRRVAATGLSVVETLVGTAFFATVIVGAVYPALTAVARADFVAAQKRAAIVAALNALTDEEMACAYGVAEPTGTSTQTIDGQTVTVSVTASAVPGSRDIRVIASDASGHVLATLATTVGPPVPAPESSAPPVPLGSGGG